MSRTNSKTDRQAESKHHATDRVRRFFADLGPGLITGAADDFYSAVLNGVLAPPLILLVVLLTSKAEVMGIRVNSRPLRYLGWATAAIMTAACIAMFVTMYTS